MFSVVTVEGRSAALDDDDVKSQLHQSRLSVAVSVCLPSICQAKDRTEMLSKTASLLCS